MQITKMFTSWKHFALINDFIYFRSSNFLFTACPYLERGNIFIIPMSTLLMNFASIVKINTFQNLRLLFVVVVVVVVVVGTTPPRHTWDLATRCCTFGAPHPKCTIFGGNLWCEQHHEYVPKYHGYAVFTRCEGRPATLEHYIIICDIPPVCPPWD